MHLPASLHQMLRDTVSNIKHLNDTYLMYKVEDEYQSLSYGQVIEKINAASAWLLEKGFRKGDRFAIIMENRPEYLIFDQALMQIGCVNVSIYPTLPEHDIEYILNDSGSLGVLAGNPFLYKKVMKAVVNNESINTIVLGFPKEKAVVHDDRVISLDSIFSEGVELYGRNHQQVEEMFHSIGRNDLASLIYTSGTTGVPKGVMLSHENFMSNVWMCKQTVPEINSSDRYLSFLPLCHVYERLATYYLGTYVGAEIAFAQSIETIAANMQEVKPTIMTTVPRLMERVMERVINNASSKGETAKKIFFGALEIGEKVRKKRENDEFINPILRLQHALADKLVFSKVRARLGGNMRMLVSGGGALPQHVGEFFGNLGIRAMEGYGLTETSPLIAVNKYNRQLFGTVGPVVPGLQVAIVNRETGVFHTIQSSDTYDPSFESPEGEILVKGPSVMQGYWNKEEDTQAVMDDEGRFHTGDVGKFYKGNLKITDRIKNMLVNAYGKNIYPTPVENIYLKSPLIEQIFLIGDNREFVTAIIVPSKDMLMAKFHLKEEFFEREEPFIRDTEIIHALGDDIKKYSKELAKYERIKNFVLKRQPFSLELGEITPTMKVKRKEVETLYSKEIEEMYKDGVEDPETGYR